MMFSLVFQPGVQLDQPVCQRVLFLSDLAQLAFNVPEVDENPAVQVQHGVPFCAIPVQRLRISSFWFPTPPVRSSLAFRAVSSLDEGVWGPDSSETLYIDPQRVLYRLGGDMQSRTRSLESGIDLDFHLRKELERKDRTTIINENNHLIRRVSRSGLVAFVGSL